MAELYRAFTPEQLVRLIRDKILADNVGLTDFNTGSKLNTLIEAYCEIASSIMFDFLNGTRKAIPVAFYDAFNFPKQGVVDASGFVRFFRVPQLIMRYIGADASCTLTVSGTALTTTTGSTPGDDLNLLFSTYPTLTDLAGAIDAHPNYTASVVNNGGSASSGLYNYAAVQLVGSVNYLNNPGRDLMLASLSSAVVVPTLVNFLVDGLVFETNVAGSIAAGDANSNAISAEAATGTGRRGNIAARALDTFNGKGSVSNLPAGVEYAVNDGPFVNGQDAETDAERLDRFESYVLGLARSTVRGIESGALSVSGIRSVSVRNNFPSNGTVTVVCDDGTGSLSLAKQNEVQDVLLGDPTDFVNNPGYIAAGVNLVVSAPTVVPTNVVAIIYRIGSRTDPAEIQNAVVTAIETYINTRRLGDDVVVSELIRRAKNAHPAIYDIEITTPGANVSVNESSLARTGANTGASVTTTIVTYTTIP